MADAPTTTSDAAPTLGQLASPAPTTQDAADTQVSMNGMASAAEAQDAAAQQVRTAAAQSVAAPPVPHARLLAMVEGLGVGLSAAGKAIATRGQEGGASEAQKYYAEKQSQKN